jgi:alkylhydroperoxidase family enzyme
LPLIDNAEDPLAREQLEKLAAGSGILNLHRIMAHAPALMKASGDMALAFRRDTVLERLLAELAILRAAQVIDCDYVWVRHLPLARACDVTERQLDELAHWPDSTRRRKKPRSASPRGSPKESQSTMALFWSCGGISRRAKSSS